MHVSARRLALLTALSTIFTLFAVGVASAAPADARYIDLSPTSSTNDSGTSHVVTADVTDSTGLVGVDGVLVTFTEVGPGAFNALTIAADEDLATAGIQITTAGLGVATVTTTTAADVVGEETITGTISAEDTSCDVGDGYCTDTVTKTWVIPATDARFIDVSPDEATNVSGTNHIVTATVTDANDSPVAGVEVTFTEDGTGFFVTNVDEDLGTAGIQVTTDSAGEAQAFTTTIAGQVGDETITGEIDPLVTECGNAAGVPDPTDAAGFCDEDVTKTWTAELPPPVSDCTITGTEGDDVLEGTEAADIICGLAGNDTITGLGGNDTLRGGQGNDTAKGGAGDDAVRGGAGDDALRAGPGNDSVKGGGGNDNLKGGSGNDALRGGKGTDTCKGGPGVDSIKGCEN